MADLYNELNRLTSEDRPVPPSRSPERMHNAMPLRSLTLSHLALTALLLGHGSTSLQESAATDLRASLCDDVVLLCVFLSSVRDYRVFSCLLRRPVGPQMHPGRLTLALAQP